MKTSFAAAALLLPVLLVACSGQAPAPGPTPLAPNPPSSPAPAATSATAGGSSPTPTAAESAAPREPAASTPNARGNVLKRVGEEAGVLNDAGKQVVSFKVTAIEPGFTCTDEYAIESANGNFIAVTLEVTTDPGLEQAFTADPVMWKVIGPDGTTENDSTGNGYGCLPTKEQLPDTIGPGERAVGKIVLDSQHRSGALVLTQFFTDGGWEWPFS